MQRNEVRPRISHVVVYMPCSKKINMIYTKAIFRHCTVFCNRWKNYELVFVTTYTTRLSAVSQEHELVLCITREVTRPGMALFWCWHRNWLVCCGGGRNRRDFSVGDRIWLDFTWRGHILLGFVWGSKKTRAEFWIGILGSRVGGNAKLTYFEIGIEVDLTWVLGLEFTRFFVRDQNWLGFMWRIETELFFVRGRKWACFLWEGRNLHCFGVLAYDHLILG